MKTYSMKWLMLLVGMAALLMSPWARAVHGPDLTVLKSCVVYPAQYSVTCTITVTNIGDVPSVAPIGLTDSLTNSANGLPPAATTLTGAGGGYLACPGGAVNGPFNCTVPNTSLAPNQHADYTLSFHMPQGGAFENCATVSQGRNSTTPADPNPGNNKSCTKFVVPPPTGICGAPNFTLSIPGAPGKYCCSQVVGGKFCCTKE